MIKHKMRIAFTLLLLASSAALAHPQTIDGLPPHIIAQKTDEIRSPATVRRFKRLNPCPSTGKRRGACPGYVVDHILPLKCNGADAVWNMQYQTKHDSLLKDRWEITGDQFHKPCSGLPR